jgi:hypothetical protein
MDPELLDLLDRLTYSDEDNVTDVDLARLRDGIAGVAESVSGDSPADLELLGDCRAALALVKTVYARRGIEWAAKRGGPPTRSAGSFNRRPGLPSVAALAASRPGRAAPMPTATTGQRRRSTLTAAADMPGLTPEADTDVEDWALSVGRRIEQIGKLGDRRADGEKVYLGRIDYSAAYSHANRQLTGRAERDREIMEATVGAQALVASGGVCGPVAVDYSVMTIAAADRPVKDALAAFGAARGGLRYILPHTLAQVTTDGPVAVWTQATDVNPGGSTKPHATFLCQSVQETYVDAVTSIVQFGNFQARYFPEQIQQYMETVDAVHSRLADSTLLAAVSNGSSRLTYGSHEVGAARDFLAAIDRAAAQYRYFHRIASGTPLRVVYPAFMHDMIRADLTRSLPGDSIAGGPNDRLGTSDDQILGWLRARGLNASPVLDSVTTGNGYSDGAPLPLQGWGGYPAVGGSGAQMQPWPSTVSAWIFHEGAWVFLDGGELNLGMVRDSTLNKSNDFQMFSETFEKAVMRGHGSVELKLSIAPTGAVIGTNAPAQVAETYGS